MAAEDNGFARTYGVGLLLERPAQLDPDRLLAALNRRCGRVDQLLSDRSDVLLFVHPGHKVEYADGQEVMVQTMLLPSDAPISMDNLETALQQTWDFPEARAAVNTHQATLYVSDFLASGLPYSERLELFHNVLLAVLDEVPCLALHWVQAQRIVDPQTYRQMRAEDGADDPVYPAINVRLFNIDGRQEGETLLDTIGLAALGVPDLQCHFLGLDANAVAHMLYGAAYYLYERGDVIGDGETLQGVGDGLIRWQCQHEDALVPPARTVIDVNPGPPYAAGDRDEE